MNDVAIIGVGLHPFGRFDKTAMEMGAEAIQFALTDAGVEWKDIQFGFGGSYEVSNPDAVTRLVGPHRHHLHQRLQRLRHRGQRHPADRRHDPAGQVRHRHRDRPGQASARRIHRRSRQARAAAVVCRERAVRHHQVLRHEGQPLPPQARHLAGDAGQGGGQELPQRRAEPECVPAQADFRRRDPQLGGAELPADAVHVLRARRRRGGRDHVPRRHRAPLHRQAGVRARHRDPHADVRRLRGARDLGAAGRGPVPHRVRGQGRVRDGGNRARGRRRRTAAGHRRRRRGHSHGRDGSVCRRRAGEAARPMAPPRSTDRCPSTPTAG